MFRIASQTSFFPDGRKARAKVPAARWYAERKAQYLPPTPACFSGIPVFCT